MEKLVVIDGNFWLFSCYYATAAMGNLMVNKDGVPTNAVYGFANRLESLLKQNPEYIVVAFDAKGKTFRSELLEEYKGTRKPTPNDVDFPKFYTLSNSSRSQIVFVQFILHTFTSEIRTFDDFKYFYSIHNFVKEGCNICI